MSDAPADPRCPECGGPIGVTATYCMHCSADLTEELERADTDDDGRWDRTEAGTEPTTEAGDVDSGTGTGTGSGTGTGTGTDSGELLDDDGLVDNTLTVLVGIAAGIVVGVIGTVVLLAVTGSAAAVVFGLLAWLGSTAYLVRRRTVQGAVSKAGYAVAAVLLLVPFVAVSPVVDVDGGIEERVGGFVVLFVFVAVPAGIAAVIGVVASRFVPDRGD